MSFDDESTRAVLAVARSEDGHGPWPLDAYDFLTEALDLAITIQQRDRKTKRQHVSAERLCEGVVMRAVDAFGLAAEAVLVEWGVRAWLDVGRMVFVCIRLDALQAQPTDRIEDFDRPAFSHELRSGMRNHTAMLQIGSMVCYRS